MRNVKLFNDHDTSVPDRQSAAVLQAMKGKRLHKVGYVDRYDFSFKTILVFDAQFIAAINDTFPVKRELYIDDVSRLAFRETEAPINDIAYELDENGTMWLSPDLSQGIPKNPGKYIYKLYNKIIRDIALVHDHYDFIDCDSNIRFVGDACLIAILYFTDDSHLLIATGSSVGASLDMYDDISVLDGYLNYADFQGIDPDDGESNLEILNNYREIIPIDAYDPGKYAAG